eukprot:TRINITY_DN14_c0_g1_i9.p1 TRINITY_DN14_c0_g1~~TRINITY_DN14_c0_g1_i9.p1  ORF type:complete len:6024 (+),score=1988.35 TRINITY_DN14_c0_g1_i9:844-18915(+)
MTLQNSAITVPVTYSPLVAGEGIQSATYNATIAGTYNVDIRIGTTGILGSPSTVSFVAGVTHVPMTTIHGPGYYTSVAGDQGSFIIQSSDAFGNNRTVETDTIVATLSHKVATYTPTVNQAANAGQGSYTMTYNATISGDYSLTITSNGQAIPGSPFTVTVKTAALFPAETYVYGETAFETVGFPGVFFVQPRDAFQNNRTVQDATIAVALTHSTGQPVYNPVPTTVAPSTSGLYRVDYNATVQGQYAMTVTVNSVAIPASPYTLQVGNSPTHAPLTVLLGAGASSGEAGLINSFLIQARDAFGNNKTTTTDNFVVQFQHTVFGGVSLTATVAAHAPSTLGQYDVTYNLTVSGQYSMTVTEDGAAIGGSPFTYTLRTAPLQLSTTRSTGPGLYTANAGQFAVFHIQSRDVYTNNRTVRGDPYLVQMIHSLYTAGNTNATVSDGTLTGDYIAVYNATMSGNYKLHVTLFDQHVPGSPFDVVVKTAETFLGLSRFSGSGLAQNTVANSGVFYIQSRDGFDNNRTQTTDTWNVALKHQTLLNIEFVASVTANNPATLGQYIVSYNVTVAGDYKIHITQGVAGPHITASPYSINFKTLPTYTPNTYVYGVGQFDATAGETGSLTIQARDAFYNNRTQVTDSYVVELQHKDYTPGTHKITATLAAQTATTGRYDVTYNATVSGQYLMSIKNNGEAMPGSPFTTTVVTGPTKPITSFAYGVGLSDATSSFYSSFILQATDRFQNNKTVTTDTWLVRLTHQTSSATVDGEVTARAPATLGQYDVRYNATVSGTYSMAVTFGSLAGPHIFGSPFTVTVKTGVTHRPNVAIYDEGRYETTAGVVSTFTIQAKDSHGNNRTEQTDNFVVQLDHKTLPVSTINAVVTSQGGTSGRYTATYTATVAGTYFLKISDNAIPIGFSPFHLTVYPAVVRGNTSQIAGSGLSETKAGALAGALFTPRDIFQNNRSQGCAGRFSNGGFHVNNFAWDKTSLSVSVWAMRGAGAATNAAIFGLSVDAQAGSDVAMYNPANLRTLIRGGGGQQDHGITMTQDVWYHIGFTFDGINRKLYINGGAPITVASAQTGLVTPTLLTVGNMKNSGSFSRPWVGDIDEFAVFNSIKVQSDFQTYMKYKLFASVPDALYNFDECATLSKALDITPQHRHGDYFGTVSHVQSLAPFVADNFTVNLQHNAYPAVNVPISIVAHPTLHGINYVTYNATVFGNYTMDVRLANSDHIDQSPYAVYVNTEVTDSRRTISSGDGIFVGEAGQPSIFHLQARDAFGNNRTMTTDVITVTAVHKVFNGVSFTGTVTKRVPSSFGQYDVVYNATVSGEYNLNVLFNGVHIQGQPSGSPFSVVMATAPTNLQISTVYGVGLANTEAGFASSFIIQAKDAFNNNRTVTNDVFNATIIHRDYPHIVLDAPVTSNQGQQEGSYVSNYNATVSGMYDIYITRLEAPIAGSPFTLKVIPTVTHIPRTRAYGVNLFSGTAGSLGTFIVQARDAYDNNRTVTTDSTLALKLTNQQFSLAPIVTGNVVSLVPAEGTYLLTFNATVSGTYKLEVTAGDGGVHIMGSPFTNIIVTAPTHLPNSRAFGSKLYDTVAGSKSQFFIQAKDAYYNNRTVYTDVFVVTFAHKTLSVANVAGSVSNFAYPGAYLVDYNTTIAGDYSVTITSNSQPLYGSPFSLNVQPSVMHPPTTTSFGSGLTTSKAGELATFYIQSRDTFYNNRSANVEAFTATFTHTFFTSPQVQFNVLATKLTASSGQYRVDYNATVAMKYSLAVTQTPGTGQNIDASPYTMETFPNGLFTPNIYPYGYGLTTGTAGYIGRFNVQPRDAYYNNRTFAEHKPSDCSLSLSAATQAAYVVNYNWPSTAYTLSFWVKNLGTTNAGAVAVTYNNDVITLKGPTQTAASGQLRVAGTDINLPANKQWAPIDGAYHHIVITWSSNTGATRLYVDGTTVVSTTNRQGFTIPQNGGVRVGYFGSGTGGDANNRWIGYIGQVSLFSTVLTDTQRTTLARARLRGDEDGLYSLWSFQGCSLTDFGPAGKSLLKLNEINIHGGSSTAPPIWEPDSFSITLTHQETAQTVTVKKPQSLIIPGATDATYTPTLAGLYTLSVKNNPGNTDVPGSPFTPLIVPDVVHPPTSRVAGVGLNESVAGIFGQFIIQSKDKFHNNMTHQNDVWRIRLIHNTYNQIVVDGTSTPLTKGQFVGKYNTTLAGTYTMSVTLTTYTGVHIFGSPFSVVTRPNVVHPPTTFATGDGLTDFGVYAMATVNLFARDSYFNARTIGNDNFTVTLTDQDSNPVPVTLSHVGSNQYRVTYVPTNPGFHQLNLQLYTNQHILNSPYNVTILPPTNHTTIAPPLGPMSGSTVVTITGENFVPNAYLVASLGGVDCASTTYVTRTQIKCLTPSILVSKTVTFATTNNKLNFSSANESQYLYYPDEIVTDFTPNNGPVYGRTIVTITGQNFLDTSLLKVKIDAAKTTVAVVYESSTKIIISTPQNEVGQRVLAVSNNDQNYVAAPVDKPYKYIEPFSPDCRTTGEVAVGVQARQLSGVSYRPNLALGASIQGSSLSNTNTSNATGIVDGDRCCLKTDITEGFKCGLNFVKMNETDSNLVQAVLTLSRAAFVNEFLTSWYQPCRNQPPFYQIEVFDLPTQKWVNLVTRVTKASKISLGTQQPCFFIPSDANDVSLCIDFLATEPRADKFRITFNNTAAEMGTADVTDYGWLYEFEVHGIFQDTPEFTELVTGLDHLPQQQSMPTVPLPSIVIRTKNHVGEVLLTNDTTTTWMSFNLTRDLGSTDLKASLISGNTNISVVAGVANFSGLAFVNPPKGHYRFNFFTNNNLNRTDTYITISTGPAQEIRRETVATATTKSVALYQIPTITMKSWDAGNNPVLTVDVVRNLTLSIPSPASNYLVGNRTVTMTNGVVSFTDLQLVNPPPGLYNISFTASDNITIPTGNGLVITVTSGDPVRLVIAQQSSNSTLASALSVPLHTYTIDALDAGSVRTPLAHGTPITFSIRNESTTLYGNTTEYLQLGTVTFSTLELRSPIIGTFFFDITTGGILNTTTDITIIIGTPLYLRLMNTPTAIYKSVPTVQLDVMNFNAFDAGNTFVGSADQVTRTVQASFVNTTTNNFLSGQKSATMTNGNATLIGLTFLAPPSGFYNVTFSVDGMSSVIFTYQILIGPAYQLETPVPQSFALKTAIVTSVPTIGVRALDAGFGFVNSTDGEARNVTITLPSHPHLLQPGGSAEIMRNGSVTFAGVKLNRPPTGTYTFTVSSANLLSTQFTVTIDTGAPLDLYVPTVYLGEVRSTLNAQVPSFTVIARDAAQQQVKPATLLNRTTVLTKSNDTNLVFNGTRTVAFNTAVVTFANVSLLAPKIGLYELTLESTNLTSTFVQVRIVVGDSYRLVLESAQQLTYPTLPTVTVDNIRSSVVDIGGNVVLDANNITVNVTSASQNQQPLTLLGQTSRQMQNGQVDFSGLTVASPANNTYKLDVSAVGLLPTSMTIVITPGPAVSLSTLTQGVDKYASASIISLNDVVVILRDATGNVVPSQYNQARQITAKLTNSTTDFLRGDVSLNNKNQSLVLFNNITLAAPSQNVYELQFSSPGLVNTSIVFEITIGVPVALFVQSATVLEYQTSNTVLISSISIIARDAGNEAVGASDAATRQVYVWMENSQFLQGSTVQQSMTQGAVTFSNIRMVRPPNDTYILQFSTATMTNATVTVNIRTGLPFALKVQPYTTTPHPSQFTVQLNNVFVSTLDAGNGFTPLTNSSYQVSVAVNGSANLLTGTLSRTFVAGQVSFPDLKLQRPSEGTYRLTFTSTGLLSTSTDVLIVIGPPVELSLTSAKSIALRSQVSTQLTPPVQLEAKDAGGSFVKSNDAQQRLVSVRQLNVSQTYDVLLGKVVNFTMVAGNLTMDSLFLVRPPVATYTFEVTSPLLARDTFQVRIDIGEPVSLLVTSNTSLVEPTVLVVNIQTITVIARDAGNTFVGGVDQVQRTINVIDSAGKPLVGTTSYTMVNGSVTIDGVQMEKPAVEERILMITSAGLVGANVTIQVVTGPAYQLKLQDRGRLSYQSDFFVNLDNIELRGLDVGGSEVGSTDKAVRFIQAIPVTPYTNVSGVISTQMVNGTVRFNNLQLASPIQANHTIRFSSPGLLNTTLVIVITEGPARHMIALPYPPAPHRSAISTRMYPFVVRAFDAGMGLTSLTAGLNCTIQNKPGATAVPLSGNLTAQFVNGNATFDQVYMIRPKSSVGTYTFSIVSAAMTSTEIKAYVVVGDAERLKVTESIGDYRSAAEVTIYPVTVRAYDAGGDFIGSDAQSGRTYPINVTLDDTDATRLPLIYSSVVTLANGVGVINQAKLRVPFKGWYSIKFDNPQLIPAFINITVDIGPGTQLDLKYASNKTITVQGAVVTAIPTFQVIVRDAGGNFVGVNDPQQRITNIKVISTAGSIDNTFTHRYDFVQLSSKCVDCMTPLTSFGVVTFQQLELYRPHVGKHVLEVSATGLSSTTLNINVETGAANRVQLQSQNGTIVLQYPGDGSKQVTVPDVVLQLVDGGGNVFSKASNLTARVELVQVIPVTRNPALPVTAGTVTRRDRYGRVVTRNTQGYTLSDVILAGQTTVQYDAQGRATFTGLKMTPYSGRYTLRYTTPGIVSVDSPYNVTFNPTAIHAVRVVRNMSAEYVPDNINPISNAPIVRIVDDVDNTIEISGIGIRTVVQTELARFQDATKFEPDFRTTVDGIVDFTGIVFNGPYSAIYTVFFYKTISTVDLSRDTSVQQVVLANGTRFVDCGAVLANTQRDALRGDRCVCSPGYYQSQDAAAECIPCAIGFYQEEAEQSQCNACPVNQDTSDRLASTSATDCSCLDGYYNTPDNPECRLCIKGAICRKNEKIEPTSGFFRFEKETDKLFRCPVAAACKGGGNSSCNVGYTGPLCSICEDGYGKFGGECLYCGSPFWNSVLVMLFMVGGSVMLLFLVRTASGEKSEMSIILKICLNYLQVVAFIGDFQMGWSDSVVEFFSFSSIALFSLQLHPLDCSLGLDFYQRFDSYMLFPVLALTIPAGVCLLLYCFDLYIAPRLGIEVQAKSELQRRLEANPFGNLAQGMVGKSSLKGDDDPAAAKRNKKGVPQIQTLSLEMLQQAQENLNIKPKTKEEEFREKYLKLYTVAVLVTMFIGHPIVSKVIFQIFNCVQFTETEAYIADDMSVSCNTDKYRFYRDTYGYMMVIVYCIGAVLVGLFILVKYRNRLDEPGVQDRFRFIYEGYARKRFYWEVIIMGRKLAIVAIIVFFRDRALTQLYSGMWMVMGALVAHLYGRPFEGTMPSRLETLSLSSSSVSLLSGLLFFAVGDELRDEDVLGVTVFVLILNFVTTIVFAILIIRAFYQLAKRQSAVLEMSAMIAKQYEELKKAQEAAEKARKDQLEREKLERQLRGEVVDDTSKGFFGKNALKFRSAADAIRMRAMQGAGDTDDYEYYYSSDSSDLFSDEVDDYCPPQPGDLDYEDYLLRKKEEAVAKPAVGTRDSGKGVKFGEEDDGGEGSSTGTAAGVGASAVAGTAAKKAKKRKLKRRKKIVDSTSESDLDESEEDKELTLLDRMTMFDEVARDDMMAAHLEAFMKKHLSEEKMSFWNDTTDFRKNYETMRRSEIAKQADQLLEIYLDDQSPQYLYVDFSVVMEMHQLVDAQELDKDMWIPVLEIIYRPIFKKFSNYYLNTLVDDELGIEIQEAIIQRGDEQSRIKMKKSKLNAQAKRRAERRKKREAELEARRKEKRAKRTEIALELRQKKLEELREIQNRKNMSSKEKKEAAKEDQKRKAQMDVKNSEEYREALEEVRARREKFKQRQSQKKEDTERVMHELEKEQRVRTTLRSELLGKQTAGKKKSKGKKKKKKVDLGEAGRKTVKLDAGTRTTQFSSSFADIMVANQELQPMDKIEIFAEVLDDKELLAVFDQFLREALPRQDAAFWRDVQVYEKFYKGLDKEDRVEEAELLVEKYIEDGAENHLGFDFGVVMKYLQQLDANEARKDMFREEVQLYYYDVFESFRAYYRKHEYALEEALGYDFV